MKAMLIRTCVLMPFAAIGGYFFLALIGCLANACGAGESFYCGIYCKFGIIFMSVLAITLIGFQVRKQYLQNH